MAQLGIVINHQNTFHKRVDAFILEPATPLRRQDLLSGLTVLDETWHFWTERRTIPIYSQHMKRTLSLASLMFLSLDHGHCQDVAKSPAFEVASITPCKPGTPEPPGEHMGMVQFTYPGGRFNGRATTLKYLIEWAYGILPAQHSGGPSWMGVQRFDVVAKAEGNATDREMKLMVRTLLAERFKLKFHMESREVPVIIVSLGKNEPKLFPPKEGEKYGIRIIPQMGPDQKPTSFHVVATRFPLAQLNETFSRQIDRVIVDQTGLKGDFDFSIDMTPDERTPNPLDPTIVLSAMRDQLGLTVKSQKSPVDFYVIESAEIPSEGN
jgi:uncharacterized protein (TIGR03435 family)